MPPGSSEAHYMKLAAFMWVTEAELGDIPNTMNLIGAGLAGAVAPTLPFPWMAHLYACFTIGPEDWGATKQLRLTVSMDEHVTYDKTSDYVVDSRTRVTHWGKSFRVEFPTAGVYVAKLSIESDGISGEWPLEIVYPKS